MVLQEHRGFLVLTELLAYQERMELRVFRVLTEHQEFLVHQEHLVYQEHQELLEEAVL